jgi:hypothetical protein
MGLQLHLFRLAKELGIKEEKPPQKRQRKSKA